MHFFDMNKTPGFTVFASDILFPKDVCTGTDMDSRHHSGCGLIGLSNKIIINGFRGQVVKTLPRKIQRSQARFLASPFFYRALPYMRLQYMPLYAFFNANLTQIERLLTHNSLHAVLGKAVGGLEICLSDSAWSPGFMCADV